MILIAGIPGTGKTYIGDYLEKYHNFKHINVELLGGLPQLNPDEDTVVTWGFQPEDQASVEHIEKLISIGAKMIWFDGNRPAALKEFIRRGTVKEVYFYLQLYRIENTRIVDKFNPKVINTFDSNGKFKDPKIIIKEILK